MNSGMVKPGKFGYLHLVYHFTVLLKKQPPDVFFLKRCSKKFHEIHRKLPLSEHLRTTTFLFTPLLHFCKITKFLNLQFIKQQDLSGSF